MIKNERILERLNDNPTKSTTEPKLSVAQTDELIELNKDILVRIGDDAEIEPIIKKRKLHDK